MLHACHAVERNIPCAYQWVCGVVAELEPQIEIGELPAQDAHDGLAVDLVESVKKVNFQHREGVVVTVVLSKATNCVKDSFRSALGPHYNMEWL